jgi:hypothetical protein
LQGTIVKWSSWSGLLIDKLTWVLKSILLFQCFSHNRCSFVCFGQHLGGLPIKYFYLMGSQSYLIRKLNNETCTQNNDQQNEEN